MHVYINKLKRAKHTIGFAPTMGALHEGHLSLMAAAKQGNTKVMASIFVNPAQFAAGEDFDKYPRDVKKDLKLLKETKNVDAVFTPDAKEIYPEGFACYVELENDMPKVLCGASRPGHFKGVTTVVAMLLNIVRPDRLYLGQKDLQQYMIINKMIKDLKYPVEAIACPIIREKDGLALSSRNMYLNPDERNFAPVLYKSLQMAESMVELGERSTQVLIKEIKRKLNEAKVETDYVEVVDPDTLVKKEKIGARSAIAAAVFIGKTRLIDNTIINLKD